MTTVKLCLYFESKARAPCSMKKFASANATLHKPSRTLCLTGWNMPPGMTPARVEVVLAQMGVASSAVCSLPVCFQFCVASSFLLVPSEIGSGPVYRHSSDSWTHRCPVVPNANCPAAESCCPPDGTQCFIKAHQHTHWCKLSPSSAGLSPPSDATIKLHRQRLALSGVMKSHGD